jgi:hypothetical protein
LFDGRGGVGGGVKIYGLLWSNGLVLVEDDKWYLLDKKIEIMKEVFCVKNLGGVSEVGDFLDTR